ncbi:hypothetical protein C4587_02100 [Candidatus Parcubacteria bacterium]|nr:MAG: hypothetical protein C4587_02100 [Candidatus Parcubacteria bacterium]
MIGAGKLLPERSGVMYAEILMKLAAMVALGILVLAIGSQIYFFSRDGKGARRDYDEVRAKLDAARLDEDKLKAELEYYSQPANLEKVLRARFNYRNRDEKLIIIVPQNASGTATSTQLP